jgi:hypothetical protein
MRFMITSCFADRMLHRGDCGIQFPDRGFSPARICGFHRYPEIAPPVCNFLPLIFQGWIAANPDYN